ncbi:MAG: choice-of-anchor B family protein [Saprospiraceae bacterium]|nr:choice-of-anchor B family protein [Saprospiraceae bacterium]
MVRLSKWDDNSLPLAGSVALQYSGCWGLDLNGREYAVLGGAAHILFFDVTDPVHPELIGKFLGTDTTVWREFKSYRNRIYAVSDNTTEGLMIFDMSQAPDTVIRTYWSNTFFNSAHTITLDTTSGRIYLNGTDIANSGLLVLDASNDPDQPEFVTNVTLAGGYIHDSYVRNDTIYASSGYDGYYVFDFTDPLSPDSLGSTKTGGYNHNSWLNPEGTYAYYTEEIPDGRPIWIVDLQTLGVDGLEIAGSFFDQLLPGDSTYKAIPHNVYIKDHLLFDSQYEDGLLVYDINNPTQPVLAAYYDTHPENVVYNRYRGNWGSYPWLPSGTIIAGDMQNGLQLLKLTTSVAVPEANAQLQVLVSPNPAKETVKVHLPENVSGWSYRLMAPGGQLYKSGRFSGQSQGEIALGDIPAGLYFMEILTGNGLRTQKKVVVSK